MAEPSSFVHRLHRKIFFVALYALTIFLYQEIAESAEIHQPRFALVIANSEYNSDIGVLSQPKNDADKIYGALKSMGFTITRKEDLSKQEMELAIKQFSDKLVRAGSGAVGFLYYAGHGGADKKDNFIVPVDAPSVSSAQPSTLVRVNWIKEQLAFIKDPAAIVLVIDACRTLSKQVDSNSPSRAASTQKFDPMADIIHSEPETGFLVGYSTSQGRAAADDSPYAEALAKHLTERGLTIPQVFEKVRYDVSSISRQIPFEQSKITSPLCLAGCGVDNAGAYETNSELYVLKRKDAETAIEKIKVHQAETRCARGWEKIVRLRDSAVQQEKAKNFNTAGKTYEEVEGTAIGIDSYLSTIDFISNGRAQLEKAQAESAAKLRELTKQGAKQEYGLWRGNFTGLVRVLEMREERLRQRILWTEIRALEKESDAYADSGNYEDALNKAIEGYNLAESMIAKLEGRRPGVPIAKRKKNDEGILPAPSGTVFPPVTGMPNNAGC